MDQLLGRAFSTLEASSTKALSALEDMTNEFPQSQAVTVQAPALSSYAADAQFAPSALSGLRRVLQHWEDLNIEGKKAEWDEVGIQISEFQETSAKNRRELAEQTRAFKAGTAADADKRRLIPSYQGEIDSLTKRAKHSETAYLTLYQMLYDAPDVVPALRTGVEAGERVAGAEQEARRYRQEVEVLRKEAANAKTLQGTVRRLEDRCRELEQELESRAQEVSLMKAREDDRVLAALQEREGVQQRQLQEARESLAALTRLHEKAQSQLFELAAEREEKRAEKENDLEMVMEEIEQAQARAVELEKAKEQLRKEVALLRQRPAPSEAAPTDGPPASPSLRGSLESAHESLKSKERLVSQLHQHIQRLELQLAGEREANLSDLQHMEQVLVEAKAANEKLQEELRERPAANQLEDLKKKLRVLQSLIGSDGDDAWDEVGDVDGGGDEAGSIHTAVRNANRRLTAELTAAKISLAECTHQLEEIKARSTELERDNEELRTLVTQLEDDIAKQSSTKDGLADTWRDGAGSGIRGLLGASSASAAAVPLSPGGAVPLSPGDARLLPGLAAGGLGKESGEAGAGRGERTMLEIVCGQRDRYRKRMGELDNENRRLTDAVGSAKQKAERLQADNLSLYEKVRFLERYNRDNAPGAVARRVGGPEAGAVVTIGGASGRKGARYACFGVGDMYAGPVTAASLERGDVAGSSGQSSTEVRYRKIYEEKLNPFNEFSATEQESRYRNLRLHDKITLTGGRFFLSNKYARTFIFFYTLLLHVLVLFIMYKFSSCRAAAIVSADLATIQTGATVANVTESLSTGSRRTFADWVADRMGFLIGGASYLTGAGP